jgi:hypothetical protein
MRSRLNAISEELLRQNLITFTSHHEGPLAPYGRLTAMEQFDGV